MKNLRIAAITALAALVMASPALATAWTFGVMGDTQWSGTDPTGNNVNTVAVNQAKACNTQFVAAGVSFVVQVGDLGDNGSVASLQTRLDCNSALTAAGIPFYGLRGNHEDNSAGQAFFNANYIPTGTAAGNIGPDTSSYSVTVNGTKIVLLDILAADSTATMDSDTTWMNSQLSAADHTQAFVFGHKNLIGQNHKDNMFQTGSNQDANPTQQNNFISDLQNNGIRYYISGHDHMHYRSMITAPNQTNQVQELICASDSYKYYTPGSPFDSRDHSISQQLNKTGYYLFTVDGPRVTGRYYETTPLSNGDVPANPTWTLSETFGYSLNGKEFLIASGASLASVQDSYNGTSMSLAGTNASTVKTSDGRLVNKDIDTGWTDRVDGQASSALTIWGMEDIDQAAAAAPFTLTMSYAVTPGYAGSIYVARQNATGGWDNLGGTLNGDGTISVSANADGTFVVVPEPATMSLILVGLGGMILRRRNRAC